MKAEYAPSNSHYKNEFFKGLDINFQIIFHKDCTSVKLVAY